MFLLLLLPLVSAQLLTPVEDQTSLPEDCQDRVVLSCSLVTVNLDAVQGDTLELPEATLTFEDQPGDTAFTFSSPAGDEAIFTVDSELAAIWGHVQLADGRDFVLEPSVSSCQGCHVWIEEDLQKFQHDHRVTLPLPSKKGLMMRSNDPWYTKRKDLFAKGKKDKTTMVTYSVKVYYTPEVAKKASNLPVLVDQLIAQTNQGYINSKIPLRLKLHCLEQTAKSEADGMNDIAPFAKSKGSATKLRGSADASVLLISKHEKYCGVGYMPIQYGGPDKIWQWPFPDTMISVTTMGCGLGSYTFGHEISHNIGNDHDKHDRAGGHKESMPWGVGFHIPGTDSRTIMAYTYQGKFQKTINYYSNPDVAWQGKPTGERGTANAARVITENRFAIAALGDESEKCSGKAPPKPATTIKPATTAKPATIAKPATTVKPVTTLKPASSAKPATTTEDYYGGGGGGYDYYG